MNIPDTTRPTCLLSARRSRTRLSLCLQKLRQNIHPTAQLLRIDLPLHEEPGTSQIRQIRSYVGKSQLIHFDAHQPAFTVCEALGPQHPASMDISGLARRLTEGNSLPAGATLEDFAELFALDYDPRAAMEAAPLQDMRILVALWQLTIRPALGFVQQIHRIPPAEARETLLVDVPEHGLPFPTPIIPHLDEPVEGWRRTPWGIPEAREAALLFADGASLEHLARILRRSPRAIVARLTIDGVLHRS